MSSRWTIVQDDQGQLFAAHRHNDYTLSEPFSRPVAAEVITAEDGTRYAICPVCGAHSRLDGERGTGKR